MTVRRCVQTLVRTLGGSLSAAMLTAESGFFAAARLLAHVRGGAPAKTAPEPAPEAAGPRGRRRGHRDARARDPRLARGEAWS